jgi:hypothetical protein
VFVEISSCYPVCETAALLTPGSHGTQFPPIYFFLHNFAFNSRLSFSKYCPNIRTSVSHLQFTRWRSWLRHCATRRKVAGSIPGGVIGIFH